jgi:hypothetical protein
MPTPARDTVRVRWAGSSVAIVSSADSAPTALGVNVTVNTQFGPPEFTLVQIGRNVKSDAFVPLIVIPEIFRTAVPVFEIETRAVVPFAKVVVEFPTVMLPKVSVMEEIPAIGTVEIVAKFDHAE